MNDAQELLSLNHNQNSSLLIIADTQSNGIGRNNNQWISNEGGLWFTYCISYINPPPQITLFLGYCLYKTLTQMYPILNDGLRIKWTNDLLYNGHKLSGILTKACSNHLLIGIGINTNNTYIHINSAFGFISLHQILGCKVSNKAIIKSFIKVFYTELDYFTAQGIEYYLAEINSNLFVINRIIEFDNNNQVVIGVCRGITDDGSLLIEDKGGLVKPYNSGSIVRCID